MENHWGITADPINIRIIVEEVNHPFCEASPDFGNWEHKYHVYHGLNALAPYAHTTCHMREAMVEGLQELWEHEHVSHHRAD